MAFFISSFNPRKLFMLHALAGLLAYPVFEHLPVLYKQWYRFKNTDCIATTGLTAAGQLRNITGFPFNDLPGTNQPKAKRR